MTSAESMPVATAGVVRPPLPATARSWGPTPFRRAAARGFLVVMLHVVAVVLGTSTPVRADVFGASSLSGTWSNAASWLNSSGTAGVPSVGDTVFIGAPGVPVAPITGTGAHITLNDTASVAAVTIGSSGTTSAYGGLTILADGQLTSTTMTLNAGASGTAHLRLDGGTLSVETLRMFGAGATLTRLGSEVIAPDEVVIGDGASLELAVGDTVAMNATIQSGGTLALGASLTLAGTVGLDAGTLELNGNTIDISGGLTLANASSIARGATAGSIQATGFSISGTSALTVIAGDVLTGAGTVASAGSLVIDAPLADITSLGVSGSLSSVTVNQELNGAANASVGVSNGATMTVNAGVTADTLSVVAASLSLGGGIIDTNHLVLGGTAGGASLSRTGAGGGLSIGSGAVTNGSSLQVLPGDAFGSLTVSDAATVLLQQPASALTGLWITTASDQALSFVGESSTLTLVFDSATTAGGVDWVLKWSGDRTSVLNELIDSGAILVNNQGTGTVQVFYDPTATATFVQVVPEPGAAGIAAGGVACLVALALNRRRRPGLIRGTRPTVSP